MRLIGRPAEVYQYLEPLYNDYRKLRRRQKDGAYVIVHMDEFIDECLREDYMLDIALPHLPRRLDLEKAGQLGGARRSALEDEIEEEMPENYENKEASELKKIAEGRNLSTGSASKEVLAKELTQ